MKQNKKRKQTLESAQYELEIIFTTVFVDTRLWKTINTRGNITKIFVSLECY